MILLAVDLGNSAAKLGLFRGKRLLRRWRILHGAPLPHLPFPPEVVGISSVNPPQLRRLLPRLRRLGVPIRVAGKDLRIPWKAVRSRGTGTDRLLATYAAFLREMGPVAVLDAGTALTLSLVDGRGRFLGGAIAAGPALSLSALARGTAQLPRLDRPGKATVGRDTTSAIRSGTALAARGFAREAADLARKTLGRKTVIYLTGGGADILQGAIAGAKQVDALVLEGIARTLLPSR